MVQLKPSRSDPDNISCRHPAERQGWRGVVDLSIEQQETNSKKEYELAAHLLALRESEVSRTKCELHDRLGPLLFAIGMNVKWVSTHCPSDNEALGVRLHETTQLIEDAVRETRRLSSELRLDALNWGSLGLEEALSECIAALEEQTHVPIHFSSSLLEGDSLSPEIASHIYDVVTKALTTTVKQPEVTNVQLALERTEEALLILIKHEGKKATPSGTAMFPSLTWQEMRARTQALGGTLHLYSSSERGTTISLSTSLPRGGRE